MIIEAAIRTELINNADILALIDTRLEYGILPQDEAGPYVVITKISAPRDHTHDGASGLVNARIQFSIFAATYLLLKQIAAAIQSVLQGYKGTMGGAGGVPVNGCFYDNEVDLGFEPQTNLYQLAVDYKIWYQE